MKDTTHFINITKKIHLEPQGILVTIDVSCLYTYIPHTEGIAAINKMMEGTGTDSLLKMLKSNVTYQVLTKNYFKFNDQLNEQKKGTTMGTRMAPNYAIIFCITWKPASKVPTQHYSIFGWGSLMIYLWSGNKEP